MKTSTRHQAPTEQARTYVSFLLFVHLFCVSIVLASSFVPSALQRKFVDVVAPYTKTLHLDPNFVPLHLTAGTDGYSRLHQWQVVDVDTGNVLHRFPGATLPGGFTRDRHDMYARVGAFHATDGGDDNVAAAMAAAFARFVLPADETSRRVLIRCVRYVDVADYTASNGATLQTDDAAINVLYSADAWRDDLGKVNVVKRTEPDRAAPPITADVPATTTLEPAEQP